MLAARGILRGMGAQSMRVPENLAAMSPPSSVKRILKLVGAGDGSHHGSVRLLGNGTCGGDACSQALLRRGAVLWADLAGSLPAGRTSNAGRKRWSTSDAASAASDVPAHAGSGTTAENAPARDSGAKSSTVMRGSLKQDQEMQHKRHIRRGTRKPPSERLQNIAKVLIDAGSDSLREALASTEAKENEWTTILQLVATEDYNRGVEILKMAGRKAGSASGAGDDVGGNVGGVVAEGVGKGGGRGGKRGHGAVKNLVEGSLEPNKFHYNVVLTTGAETKMPWAKIAHVYSMMKSRGVAPDETTFSTLVTYRSTSQGAEWAEVEDLMEEMMIRDGPWQHTMYVYNARLFAYSYFGRWRECKETLEEMERRKCVFTHNSLAAAVRCAGLAQHLDEAFAVWDDMVESKGVHPSPKCWDTLVKACGYSQNFEEAMKVVGRMQGADVSFGTFTYVGLLESCKCHSEVRSVKRLMQEQGHSMTVPMHICVIKLCGLLAAEGNISEVDHAVAILDDLRTEAALEGARVPAPVYNATIAVCGRGGNLDKAFEVFDRLVSDGIPARLDSYRHLFTACHRAGDMGDSKRVFKSMADAGFSPDRKAYNGLISACSKSMDWEMAEEVFVEMESKGITPDAISFNALIAAYDRAVQEGKTYAESETVLAKGHAVYTQMKARGVAPTTLTYLSLIHLCSQSGEADRAMEYWRLMEKDRLVPRFAQYNVMVDAMWAHDPDMAYQLFVEGLPTFGGIFEERMTGDGMEWTLNLRRLSGGTAQAACIWWIQERLGRRLGKHATESVERPARISIYVCWGLDNRKPWKTHDVPVFEMVERLLESFDAPLRHMPDYLLQGSNGGRPGRRIELDAAQVEKWIPHAVLCAQSNSWRLRV